MSSYPSHSFILHRIETLYCRSVFNYVLIQFRISFESVSLDSSAGIATRYDLGGPGIESRWGRRIPHLSRPALGRTQSSVQ
jgi:hypothetical protein